MYNPHKPAALHVEACLSLGAPAGYHWAAAIALEDSPSHDIQKDDILEVLVPDFLAPAIKEKASHHVTFGFPFTHKIDGERFSLPTLRTFVPDPSLPPPAAKPLSVLQDKLQMYSDILSGKTPALLKARPDSPARRTPKTTGQTLTP